MNYTEEVNKDQYMKDACMMKMVLDRGIPYHSLNELLGDVALNAEQKKNPISRLETKLMKSSTEGINKIRLRVCPYGHYSISSSVFCQKCLKERRLTRFIQSCQCETCIANNAFNEWYVKEREWRERREQSDSDLGVEPCEDDRCPEPLRPLLRGELERFSTATCCHSRFSGTEEEHLVETFLCFIVDLVKMDWLDLMTNTTPEALYLQLDYQIKEKWFSNATSYNRLYAYQWLGMISHARKLSAYLDSIPTPDKHKNYLHDGVCGFVSDESPENRIGLRRICLSFS